MTAPGGGGRGWWVSFTSCLLVSSKHTSTSVDPELTVVDLQHVLDGADELMAQTNSALPGGGVHQHSFSQGLSAFFQCLAHGFGADAVHYLACHQPVRQQLQRPGGPALRLGQLWSLIWLTSALPPKSLYPTRAFRPGF